MSLNEVSLYKRLAVAGVASLMISVSVQAQERTEVLERIKPIGQVTVGGSGAAAPATAAAPAAQSQAPVAQAAPADPGAALYQEKGCTACHGVEGRAPIQSTYPKLAALPETYLANQMTDIKSGARDNGQTAAMKGIMASVSEDDIQQIAKWLSELPREGGAAPAASAPQAEAASAPAAAAPAAAAPAAAASGDAGETLYTNKGCGACHGPQGNSPIMTTYPKVTALSEQYIVNQLKDIKSGARDNGQTAAMKAIMGMVSEDDMKAIAAWLAKQPR